MPFFTNNIDTFCKAIDNNQLIGFPPITSNQVRKYLPESTATAKGHMNRLHKGTRFTTKQRINDNIIIEQDFWPITDEDAGVELFIGATIAEQNEGTIYTDNTGRFPIQSFHGKKVQFVAYEYWSNAILVRALRDETDKSMVEAFQDIYTYLTDRGFKPKLNVMDNQCSRAVQTYIKSTGANIQLRRLPGKCSWKSNTNMEKPLDSRNGHTRSKLPTTTVVSIHWAGTRHTKYAPGIQNKSKALELCRLRRTIRFQQNHTCASRNKSTGVPRSKQTKYMAKPCNWCMVRWSSKATLPKLLILHPRNKRISHLSISKILPSTLQNASNRARRHCTSRGTRSHHRSNAKTIKCTNWSQPKTHTGTVTTHRNFQWSS